jgi:hypothetical protein
MKSYVCYHTALRFLRHRVSLDPSRFLYALCQTRRGERPSMQARRRSRIVSSSGLSHAGVPPCFHTGCQGKMCLEQGTAQICRLAVALENCPCGRFRSFRQRAYSFAARSRKSP